MSFHVDSKYLYELKTVFQWLRKHKEVLQKLKDKLCQDISSAIPNTNYSNHFHADSSNVGAGCILIKEVPVGKKIISTNSRDFEEAEQ